MACPPSHARLRVFSIIFWLSPRLETIRRLSVFSYCFTELFMFLWSSQRMGPHPKPRTKPSVCPIWSTRIHPGTFVYFWGFRWEIRQKPVALLTSVHRQTQKQKATDISKLERKRFVHELTCSYIVLLVKSYRSAKRTNFYSCCCAPWNGNDLGLLKVTWNSGE